MTSFARIALLGGAAFGIPMGLIAGVAVGLVRGFTAGLQMGVVAAVAMGLAFGLVAAGLVEWGRRRIAKNRPEFTGEPLLHDGPANHFLNGEGVGGWLFLTRDRLLFQSHPINLQPHEWSLPLAEIAEVQAVRTAGIFPNGLRLVTQSGRTERFVVEEHVRWSEEIGRAKAQDASKTPG